MLNNSILWRKLHTIISNNKEFNDTLIKLKIKVIVIDIIYQNHKSNIVINHFDEFIKNNSLSILFKIHMDNDNKNHNILYKLIKKYEDEQRREIIDMYI